MFVCFQGVELNGVVFRENGGVKCALTLIRFKKPRRMALKLMRQLILLEGMWGVYGVGWG